jgi:poly-gamma-glutamate synthesis protein (capsule biosynthesis protein)
MLGRGVAERILTAPERRLFFSEVTAAAREADVTILNLESCVSRRGSRWPDPKKPFFLRAPPEAPPHLHALGGARDAQPL